MSEPAEGSGGPKLARKKLYQQGALGGEKSLADIDFTRLNQSQIANLLNFRADRSLAKVSDHSYRK